MYSDFCKITIKGIMPAIDEKTNNLKYLYMRIDIFNKEGNRIGNLGAKFFTKMSLPNLQCLGICILFEVI